MSQPKLMTYKKWAVVVILIILSLTASAFYKLKDLQFDYNFEDFFGENQEETQFFYEHRQRFETDNDFIFISLENPQGVFNTPFLKKVEGFTNELSQQAYVQQVSSLTNLTDYIKTPFSKAVFKVPYLSICDSCDYTADSIRIFSRPEVKALYINKDATGLLLNVKHQENISKVKCDSLKNQIDELLIKYDFQHYHYSGRAIGQSYYIEMMQNETALFISLSFVLVLIFLWFTYKSWWGLWIPLSIVTTSMVWILGFMSIVGEPINLVLTVLPPIIFVVAMSDVIHLVSKYLDELRDGLQPLEAIKKAYKEVGVATLMTSVTTAIGFLSLLMVPLKPVRIFGIYTALGVLFAFLLAYTLLPALLILTKPPKLSTQKLTQNHWYNILHLMFKKIMLKRQRLVGVLVIILALVGVGMSQMQSNYFLLEDLKKDNPMRTQFDYFDQNYMGMRPFELSVQVADTNQYRVTDYEVIQEMNKLDSFLVADYELKHVNSLVSLVKMANRSEHGGQMTYYQLPDKKMTKKIFHRIEKMDRDHQLRLLYDSTKTYTRMQSTIGDIGKYAINQKNERLYQFIDEHINPQIIDVHLTGTGHVMDLNMGTISKSLTFGLLQAVLLVALLMGVLYRSFKMVVIAIIPNVLPLLMLGAFMGFTGIDLKVSTAIIFTISFGIAVDDTIHFMSKFKLELNKGKSVMYALKRTYLSTGKAIVLTTLILISGFLMLLFSDFLGTYYIGLLLSLTLLFALFADLVILPLLIMLFYKKKS